MALSELSRGKQIGLTNAKEIFKFTKNDFEDNVSFVPLLNDYFNGKISCEDAENILFSNLIKALKTTGISDWSKIDTFLGSENVFKVFNHIQDDLTDKDYWTVLGECYVMSSFSHSTQELIKTFFNSERPDKLHIMTDEERLEFDSLPNEIEIYRGCSEYEIKSGKFRFSWTTKKSVAQFFAKRSKTMHGIKNSVVSRLIKKEEVFAYFNRRNEFEIIYFQNS
jgi:hypothetical protein